MMGYLKRHDMSQVMANSGFGNIEYSRITEFGKMMFSLPQACIKKDGTFRKDVLKALFSDAEVDLQNAVKMNQKYGIEMFPVFIPAANKA